MKAKQISNGKISESAREDRELVMNEKILIIDDDIDVIEATKVVLGTKGYQVFSAVNKQEGFERVEGVVPDLIIMDVMMERMNDGIDLTRKLKQDSRYQRIPILMLTAVGQVTGFKFHVGEDDNFLLPVDDYCTKPLSLEVLLSKVEKLLHSAGKK